MDVCGRSNGFAITCDVNGTINCNCRLTGMPDCTLTFEDPYKLDDCAFHPCVRYQRFEVDQQLSFIPPDGKFKLLSFVARCEVAYRACRFRVVCILYCAVSSVSQEVNCWIEK